MAKRSSLREDLLPLRQPTFYVLLSLAPGEKHGYAILKEVEALSQGKVKLSTGTLYEALARLLDQGLIERVEREEASGEGAGSQPHPGKPRKAYRLTQAGRSALEAEIDRMQVLVSTARRQLKVER